MFFILCMLMHMLPGPVLDALGQASNVISDMSPEFMRSFEHVIFTLLLN